VRASLDGAEGNACQRDFLIFRIADGPTRRDALSVSVEAPAPACRAAHPAARPRICGTAGGRRATR
jgi:hypothetical protein